MLLVFFKKKAHRASKIIAFVKELVQEKKSGYPLNGTSFSVSIIIIYYGKRFYNKLFLIYIEEREVAVTLI